jgi:hypothetical protein
MYAVMYFHPAAPPRVPATDCPGDWAKRRAFRFTQGMLAVARLPEEPNRFIGREREIAELRRMLPRARALTLGRRGTVAGFHGR